MIEWVWDLPGRKTKESHCIWSNLSWPDSGAQPRLSTLRFELLREESAGDVVMAQVMSFGVISSARDLAVRGMLPLGLIGKC